MRWEINELLTIIHLHKQSRKLWAEKESFKKDYMEVMEGRSIEELSGISSTKRGGFND